jgi:hypothetical protein
LPDDWYWFTLREKYCSVIAGGWFVLRENYSERRVLLADCWWLVCSERKVLLSGGTPKP